MVQQQAFGVRYVRMNKKPASALSLHTYLRVRCATVKYEIHSTMKYRNKYINDIKTFLQRRTKSLKTNVSYTFTDHLQQERHRNENVPGL